MRGPVEIADGIHALGSEVVNWYLVEEDGRLTAVDAGLPKFRETLEADLRAIGRAPGEVDAVVLTHSDSDHTGVASALRDAGARPDAADARPDARGAGLDVRQRVGATEHHRGLVAEHIGHAGWRGVG